MWTFDDIYKPTIWGGDRISRFKGSGKKLDGIGESWELSGIPGSESVVASDIDKGLSLNGLIDKYQERLLGSRNFAKFGNNFPLLVKFIDACQDLSLQVHPNDNLANELGFSCGKNELWYTIDSKPGGKIINGFKQPLNPDDYESLVNGTGIIESVNHVEMKPGDAVYIPAGTIHAIGAGLFIAEVQQTSDLTYRIFDYHRKNDKGEERKLHTEQARKALDFNFTGNGKIEYYSLKNVPVNLVTTPIFTTNLITVDHEVIRDYSEWDTFVILVCVSGDAEIEDSEGKIQLTAGHTALISAVSKGVTIHPGKHGFTALEVYIK